MKNNIQTCKFIERHPDSPILVADQVPYSSELVFNAGVVKHKGKYMMVFRNDYDYVGGTDFKGTNIGLAISDDGISWEVQEKPFYSLKTEEINRAYDPRLTIIEDEVYMCFAVDTNHGIRGGIAKVHDFEEVEILSLSTPDNRNMVLFPEKINNKFYRLERPFTVYSRGGADRFDIWSSNSKDLVYWGESELVMAVEDFPYANDKIGPAAPPIKTDKGWLTIVHTVDYDESRGKNGWEDTWKKRYCAGLALLDLENPSKVIGLYKEPLMVPEVDYEAKDGFRTNVIFPTSMILEDDGEVKIYYGAADTVIGLATAKLSDLLSLFE